MEAAMPVLNSDLTASLVEASSGLVKLEDLDGAVVRIFDLVREALDDDLVDGETTKRYVQTMGANVRALGTLVDDLFELSRLNAGDFTWTTQVVPLSELIQETIAAIRAQADAGKQPRPQSQLRIHDHAPQRSFRP